ncbi:hypothetical protein Ccel01_03280 [Cellulosimicrobium cellulans]|uniref:Uncharacterized protein n=1 Tax=Cellulosimicrobium cellulans TaxID=1710 RepID=A0AAV5P1S9_CELCE|nr:hypothetical protein Ccel01_03280 [Cellulosimicrobium cellulans]
MRKEPTAAAPKKITQAITASTSPETAFFAGVVHDMSSSWWSVALDDLMDAPDPPRTATTPAGSTFTPRSRAW